MSAELATVLIAFRLQSEFGLQFNLVKPCLRFARLNRLSASVRIWTADSILAQEDGKKAAS